MKKISLFLIMLILFSLVVISEGESEDPWEGKKIEELNGNDLISSPGEARKVWGSLSQDQKDEAYKDPRGLFEFQDKFASDYGLSSLNADMGLARFEDGHLINGNVKIKVDELEGTKVTSLLKDGFRIEKDGDVHINGNSIWIHKGEYAEIRSSDGESRILLSKGTFIMTKDYNIIEATEGPMSVFISDISIGVSGEGIIQMKNKINIKTRSGDYTSLLFDGKKYSLNCEECSMDTKKAKKVTLRKNGKKVGISNLRGMEFFAPGNPNSDEVIDRSKNLKSEVESGISVNHVHYVGRDRDEILLTTPAKQDQFTIEAKGADGTYVVMENLNGFTAKGDVSDRLLTKLARKIKKGTTKVGKGIGVGATYIGKGAYTVGYELMPKIDTERLKRYHLNIGFPGFESGLGLEGIYVDTLPFGGVGIESKEGLFVNYPDWMGPIYASVKMEGEEGNKKKLLEIRAFSPFTGKILKESKIKLLNWIGDKIVEPLALGAGFGKEGFFLRVASRPFYMLRIKGETPVLLVKKTEAPEPDQT